MKLSIVDKDGNPADVSYATKHSAGFDIKADLSALPVGHQCVRLQLDGGPKKIPTGLFLKVEGEVENGMVPALLVTPRSGMSLWGWSISNSPGLIDADYKGEIMIIMSRSKSGVGGAKVKIDHGDKIAQGVFIMVPRFDIPAEDVDRGAGGFGSTDKKIVTPPIKKK